MNVLFSRLLQRKKKIRVIFASPMYQHPYLEHFKKQRKNVSPDFHKKSTGLTGLLVNEKPHHTLTILYNRILKVLDKMGKTSVYRKNTEEIIKNRLALVHQEPNILKLEEKLGMGQIEEIIKQAQYELETARELLNAKVWEPLVEKPSDAQWRWPIN